MRTRGLETGSQLLNFETVPANILIANQLSIQEDELVYEIKRIRLAHHGEDISSMW